MRLANRDKWSLVVAKRSVVVGGAQRHDHRNGGKYLLPGRAL